MQPQTLPRDASHLSLPLTETGNGTMHKVNTQFLFKEVVKINPPGTIICNLTSTHKLALQVVRVSFYSTLCEYPGMLRSGCCSCDEIIECEKLMICLCFVRPQLLCLFTALTSE